MGKKSRALPSLPTLSICFHTADAHYAIAFHNNLPGDEFSSRGQLLPLRKYLNCPIYATPSAAAQRILGRPLRARASIDGYIRYFHWAPHMYFPKSEKPETRAESRGPSPNSRWPQRNLFLSCVVGKIDRERGTRRAFGVFIAAAPREIGPSVWAICYSRWFFYLKMSVEDFINTREGFSIIYSVHRVNKLIGMMTPDDANNEWSG